MIICITLLDILVETSGFREFQSCKNAVLGASAK